MKLFSKVATLSVGLAMAIGVGVAVGSKEAKVAKADDYSLTFSSLYSADTVLSSIEQDGFSMTFNKGTGSNDPKYFTNGTAVRIYANNYLVVSADETITEITYTISGNYSGTITVDSGTYASGTWTGESTSVKFSNTGSSQWRFTAITVTTGAAVLKHTISFAAGDGSGSMPSVKVEDGDDYELPSCTFTAPAGKVFDAWSIDDEEKAPGEIIVVEEDKTVTALWKDIVRVDLPDGEYNVEVSYSGRSSVPTSEYFEIKQPVGDTYYKNLKVEYSSVAQKFSNEYTLEKSKTPNSRITVTSESNAVIESVTFDLYQYVNAVVEVGGVEVSQPVSGKGDNHRSFEVDIKAKSFSLVNKSTYDQSLWGFTVALKASSVPDPVVNIDEHSSIVAQGDVGTLTASSQYATNPSYSWSSDNTQVLTINASTGEYEALKPGKATVTVTMTCDEGSDSRFAVINVTPDHTLTVTEAREIAASLDGDAQESTEYFVNVKGYITSLDADTKIRAFNICDVKNSTENNIMIYGVYSSDVLRTYAVLNGFVEFRGHIQNYKGTYEVKDLTLISYTDEAIEFATSAYQSLQEACNVGVDAVTSTQWETLAGEFDGIDANAKVKLTADDISNYGEAIQNWVDRYTRIVSNTELNDFMQLGVSSSLLRVSQNSLEDNNIMIIVISIAAVSALAFTMLLVFKKKKQK